MPTSAQPLSLPEDMHLRFVEFQRLTPEGFVEFAFGVGSTDLMVDLIMPVEEYQAFCQANNTICVNEPVQQIPR